ncbi:MAG: TetR/AcrR family transcriptional regulator [Burkholderiales bacterium]|nr:TetR/AcrR family transcriptional regulator [Burkholderiales bacterium]
MSSSRPFAAKKPASRIRMDAASRKQSILDAALHHFSTRGYEASRIDDIAADAGLSKGGFYAHFASKDEVFQALLARSLAIPTLDVSALIEHSASARELSERLIKVLYAPLSKPGLMAVSKLLLTEGHRLPELVERWRQSMLNSLYTQIAGLLGAAVAKGICRDSVACREPWLVIAPLAYLVTQRLAHGTSVQPSLRRAQRLHVEMLSELLEPVR